MAIEQLPGAALHTMYIKTLFVFPHLYAFDLYLKRTNVPGIESQLLIAGDCIVEFKVPRHGYRLRSSSSAWIALAHSYECRTASKSVYSSRSEYSPPMLRYTETVQDIFYNKGPHQTKLNIDRSSH